MRLPDVSFVAADRVKTHDRDTYYQLAPDLAIEIISPSETCRRYACQDESCSLIKNTVGYPPKSYGGSQPMGIQVRDERQMKALTGLSQAQFDDLLPVFSDIYRATQQQHYEAGVASGTRK